MTYNENIQNKQEIEQLVDTLAYLSNSYRGADPYSVEILEIIDSYHQTLKQLEVLGWSGMLTPDCELPGPLMPEGYQHQFQSWNMPTQPSLWQQFRQWLQGGKGR